MIDLYRFAANQVNKENIIDAGDWALDLRNWLEKYRAENTLTFELETLVESFQEYLDSFIDDVEELAAELEEEQEAYMDYIEMTSCPKLSGRI